MKIIIHQYLSTDAFKRWPKQLMGTLWRPGVGLRGRAGGGWRLIGAWGPWKLARESAKRGARGEWLSEHLRQRGCLLKHLLQEAHVQSLHGLNRSSTSGIKNSPGFSIWKVLAFRANCCSLHEICCACAWMYLRLKSSDCWHSLLEGRDRRALGPSPENLATPSKHLYALLPCGILCANLHAVLSSGCWGRSRVYMSGRLRKEAPSMWLWRSLIHAESRLLDAAALSPPRLLPAAPHPRGVSKPNKFIGSPVGAMVESYFTLSLGP